MEKYLKKALKQIIFIPIFMLMMNSLTMGQEKKDLIISSAISMKEAVGEIIQEYEKENPKNNINFLTNFGASGSLRAQIENGAPVDIVMFADTKNMDKLEDLKIIDAKDRVQIIYNAIILVGYKNLNKIEDLEGKKISIGQPVLVPLGTYSKEYLDNMGIYNKIEKDIIFAKDAKSVFNYIEREEVDYAIIYKSELKNIKNSKIVFEVDDSKYTKPNYSFAMVKERKDSENEKFFLFLQSNTSKNIFKKYGFKISE